MTDTNDDAATPAETTTTTKSSAKATKAATPAAKEPTKTDVAAADKALATYYETGHVPAGWIFSRGEMRKRTDG